MARVDAVGEADERPAIAATALGLNAKRSRHRLSRNTQLFADGLESLENAACDGTNNFRIVDYETRFHAVHRSFQTEQSRARVIAKSCLLIAGEVQNSRNF